MTDHLAAARADLDRLEACNHGSRLASAVAHILDHLDAQQTDASIRRGLDDVAAGRTEHLGRFTDDEPDPLDESNHADRYDLDGEPWEWCDQCAGFRHHQTHSQHLFRLGLSASKINQLYGPLTFAPRPADTPTTAPQPDEAHGDADDPARPAEAHTAPETYDVRERYFIGVMVTTGFTYSGSEARNDFDRWLGSICAEAWGKGYWVGRLDEQDSCHCEAWSDDECGCGNYGASTTPNPYRKDRA